jgi:hypothetical protein
MLLGTFIKQKVFYGFRYILETFFFLKTRLKRLSVSKAEHNMTKWMKSTQSAANMIKQKLYYMVNTSYLTDSYIGLTLKMESVSKNTIFGLKMMVKSGLKNYF